MTIEFVIAAGTDALAVRQKALSWSSRFSTQFDSSKDLWQQRFEQAFIPNNTHFSGSLPILRVPFDQPSRTHDPPNLSSESAADHPIPAIARMYYLGVVSFLSCERTNLPHFPRVYVTGAAANSSANIFFLG